MTDQHRKILEGMTDPDGFVGRWNDCAAGAVTSILLEHACLQLDSNSFDRFLDDLRAACRLPNATTAELLAYVRLVMGRVLPAPAEGQS